MEYQEYLEKLGIKTSDKDKEKKLKNFIVVQLREFYDRYWNTNINTIVATKFFKENCIDRSVFSLNIVAQVFDTEKDIKKVMLYYSTFLNIINTILIRGYMII